MNKIIEKVDYARLLDPEVVAMNYASGLINYPIAEKITNAKLGTYHTVAYKSINKDVPGLIVYKKIRLHLTKYAAQKAVQEAWANGKVKRSNKTDWNVHFKNNIKYNIKTGKYTFSFVPYEKLQEKFVLNGWEISAERAQELIKKAKEEKPKKVYKESLIPWRTIELANIIAFN